MTASLTQCLLHRQLRPDLRAEMVAYLDSTQARVGAQLQRDYTVRRAARTLPAVVTEQGWVVVQVHPLRHQDLLDVAECLGPSAFTRESVYE